MAERRPELLMVRKALLAGLLALPVAALAGTAFRGADGAISAAIAVTVVIANFAAHGLSLAWAAGISLGTVHGVALGGFVVRMGVIVALLFLLDGASFFSTEVFGITAVIATLLLLGYEAQLVRGGVGTALQIPPEPAAAAGAERLRAREEALR